MIELGAAFFVGLVGSLHCAGMCGPLALALPRAGKSRGAYVVGRCAYNCGRVIAYCALGLVFGLIGKSLFMAGVQRWVSIGLGALLLAGLFGAKRFASWNPALFWVSRLKSSMAGLLQRRSISALALLGILNGFLPCGLVYVACAGAVATGGLLSGVAYMALFGLGTIPLMLVLSLSGSAVPISVRLKFRKAIPVAVALLAGLLILRGMELGIPYVSPILSSSACCH
jgi:sulfite exporter TauE/SafE